MNPRIPQSTLVCAAVLGSAASVRVAGWPLIQISIPSATSMASTRTGSAPAIIADSLGGAAVDRDPFRLARHPASVAYDPVRLTQPEAPAPPKPQLSLVGVVTGTDPTALLEGLPGIEGARLVRVGDVVAGLSVRRIDSLGVRIVGMDTVWVLQVRKPWN